MIIHRCGFNYEGLTSSPTGASTIIRNVSLRVNIACFAKQTFSIQNHSQSSYFSSVKLVRGMDAVQNLPWAVMSCCFVVLMDFPDQNLLHGTESCLKNY